MEAKSDIKLESGYKMLPINPSTTIEDIMKNYSRVESDDINLAVNYTNKHRYQHSQQKYPNKTPG